MSLQNKSQALIPSRLLLKRARTFKMSLCKNNSSITVKYNNFDYLKVRKSTLFSFPYDMSHLKSFRKRRKNMLLKIFLSI